MRHPLAMAALGILTSGFSVAGLQAQDSVIAQSSDTPETATDFVTADAGHATSGMLDVIEEDGTSYLVFSEDFETGRGPDVKVILYRDDVIPVVIDEEDYITLADLEKFRGTQRYEVPETVDLEEFETVGVWCEKFNITFGYAPLSADQ